MGKTGKGNGLDLLVSGIRVLALKQLFAGPLCGRRSADRGADLIKIARPAALLTSRRGKRAPKLISAHKLAREARSPRATGGPKCYARQGSKQNGARHTSPQRRGGLACDIRHPLEMSCGCAR
jgi:hypothetical protein